ncbi:MAG: hypothetical protein K8T90_20455 [Planctomycetes bacterium]|nr:hypothetical protein [Planctomycetota bacterium]
MKRTLACVAVSAAALLAGACDDERPAPVAPSPVAPAQPKPAAAPTPATDPNAPIPAAPAAATPTPAQVDAAIRKGSDYLVRAQNKDGSWGSTAPTLTIDIYAPGPGAYEAYQVATSALAVSALIDVTRGGFADVKGAEESIRRGTDFLMAHSRVPRASIDVLYNSWAHAYMLETFARLLATEKDEARRAALKKASADCLDMLATFEYAEGGWGYYDFNSQLRKPADGATSFGTASVLTGMRMAKDQGVTIPKRLVDRAVAFLEKLRHPDGSFAYSWDHRFWPQGPINKIKGSLARTPACYAALRDWGTSVTDAQVVTAFDNLEKEGRFLHIARKYPRPHETWYQNSGYFTFYGYENASRLLPVLTKERRARAVASFTTYLVPLQEPDGSWWDYQLYGYHKPYGTAYVLSTLTRCR